MTSILNLGRDTNRRSSFKAFHAALRRTLASTSMTCALVCVMTGVALAQSGPSKSEHGHAKSGVPSSFGPAPQLNVGSNEEALARRIDLSIGKSIIVDLPREAKEIFVANPKVANAIVRSSKKLFIIGIADGFTTIFALDDAGRQIAALEIAVGRDLNVLRTMLRGALPGANIDIKPAGDSILLTGQVGSVSEGQQAVDIANAFVGVSGGAFSSTRGAVVNGLTVKGKDQVMVKVTVAEVSRAVLKQLGITTTGSWASISGASTNPFSLATQTLAATTLSAVVQRGSNTTEMTLRAFERNGLSRTLAEPVLTAISGESAKFTAGGEIPIPKSQTCSTDALGRRACEIGIEFKPFGVSLNITPFVMAENRISLKVATEVTELDAENQVRFDTINVVGTKVRKSDTTVELPSGGSIMTAGLIQQASRQVINGFPGLMNLPVLGALFRSRDYQRQETELVIIVTPIIAKPMSPNETARPDDGYADAHDGQTILLGRLHKIYGVAGAPTEGIALKGRYGFIND
jgi:pilus assembly protein CpaC